MTRLLEAHTEAIAAQTQATAAQHLPPLKAFTDEGKQMEEDGFERVGLNSLKNELKLPDGVLSKSYIRLNCYWRKRL